MTLKKGIIFLMAGIILLSNSSFNMPPPQADEEYALKAAFIYRFTDYIEWTNNKDASQFTIAILGESKITTPLFEIALSKKVKGKSMNITQVESVNATDAYQVLFIPNDYKGDIGAIASTLSGKSILIITEQTDACKKGAHVNFFIAENKLKFEINLKAAIRSRLKISSDLLQHATLVDEP